MEIIFKTILPQRPGGGTASVYTTKDSHVDRGKLQIKRENK